MSGCRIARVRDRATGRSLEILPGSRRDGLAATLVDHAATIADNMAGDCAGFFIVGIDRRGHYSSGMRLDGNALIGPTLFTALLTEIVRRDVATEEAIVSFSVRQGWIDE